MKNYMPQIIGFHGCDKNIAESVLGGATLLKASENNYDWLGTGIYFWVDSYERALEWAKNNDKIKTPFVVGVFIQPKYCLNLTDYGTNKKLKYSYDLYIKNCKLANMEIPQNQTSDKGIYLKRNLDCAVINFTHFLNEDNNKPSYDTVYGVFEEGESLYPNSGIKEKTHIQIAVRNQDCIIGYFRPKELSNII